MNLNFSQLLYLIAALTLLGAGALIATAVVTHTPIQGPQEQVVQAPQPTRRVLAPVKDLKANIFVQPTDFRWIDVAENLVRPEFITQGIDDINNLAGAILLKSVAADQPVDRRTLISPRERGFLAAALSPDTRAVSIAVDEVTGAAGLIYPDDHVDVILTFTVTGQDVPAAKRTVGETVLQNIRVLAVDQTMRSPTDDAPKDGTAAAQVLAQRKPARTMTLEVKQQDAQKLTVAANLGKITLSLRGLTNALPAGGALPDAVFAGDVSKNYDQEKPQLPPVQPPAPAVKPDPLPQPGVTILRGGASGR